MKIFMANSMQSDFTHNESTISHMNYSEFLKDSKSFSEYIRYGISGQSLFAKLRNPEYLHKLYREKNIGYLKYLDSFREKYHDYDVILMNPGVDLVHPEYLNLYFKNTLKVLHFVDDPHTTYSYGLPFSWVFDAATYISPSYSEDLSMEEILALSGFTSTYWFPHCVSNISQPKWTLEELSSQLKTREKKAVYVGNFYSGKIERLIYLKKILKKDFDIYGRFPFKGYSFPVFSLINKNPHLYIPKQLSNTELEDLYISKAVGINMHLSNPTIETGNARLYELAYRGVAQVVDTSTKCLVEEIFQPENEILTYRTMDECIYQSRRLLNDDELRCKIALAAYERAKNHYSYSDNLTKLIEWFKKLLN